MPPFESLTPSLECYMVFFSDTIFYQLDMLHSLINLILSDIAFDPHEIIDLLKFDLQTFLPLVPSPK